jgi:hypothetical protein
MALHHPNIAISGDRNVSARAYFVRYRVALYLSLGAVVASGIILNWKWLTAAGLIPVLAFLPCMLMMFMCMKRGTGPTDETASPDKTLPSRFPTSSDIQR